MTPLSAAVASRAWRFVFLDSPPADGVTNMATDLALMDHARRTGEATLRVYSWARPTLSFGRHERTKGRFDARVLEDAGVDTVRRPTGGRALLHHREVTYSVTAPAAGLSLGESYRAVNALLLDALSLLGVSASPAERRGRASRPGTAPCFAEPNEGELTVDDAKLVGSAQWRDDGALLQHGSILLEDDQRRIAALAARLDADSAPAADAPSRVATLSAILGRPVAAHEVRDALREALRSLTEREPVTSPSPVESHLGTSGALATLDAHRAWLGDPSWTWRR